MQFADVLGIKLNAAIEHLKNVLVNKNRCIL